MHIEVVLTLPRDAASIPLARHTVTSALQHAGITAECVDEVEVALSEACTNAYRHAHDGDSFEVVIHIFDESLTVDVRDTGTGLGPRAAPVVMPHPESDGGRGMALITAFSDSAVFDTITGDGTSVHLVKHLRWSTGAPFGQQRAQDGRAPRPAPS